VPLRAPAIDIPPNTTWKQNAITVAGGNGQGNGSNQLYGPFGLYVDDNETIYVADRFNHRIVEWEFGVTSGRVVAGGNGEGDGAHQLNYPWDMIVDKERDSLIICDKENRRVVRWPRHNGGTNEETIISNIDCLGLTMDENGYLYVVDSEKHEVIRYRMGENEGIVVAGGNDLDQLFYPQFVFVDRDHSVYVSDEGNHHVTKWEDGAKEGMVVAGTNETGDSLIQLNTPKGVVVDQLGTVYVADERNHRIMRWTKENSQGSVIAGGNGQGERPDQLYHPVGLSFDRHGNLYVADDFNQRVQKFEIEQTINE
jgi:sugar lactone lactonase YvrE